MGGCMYSWVYMHVRWVCMGMCACEVGLFMYACLYVYVRYWIGCAHLVCRPAKVWLQRCGHSKSPPWLSSYPLLRGSHAGKLTTAYYRSLALLASSLDSRVTLFSVAGFTRRSANNRTAWRQQRRPPYLLTWSLRSRACLYNPCIHHRFA
jgi:hypothetical protein